MTTIFLLVDAQKNMLLPPGPVPDAGRITSLLKELLDRARVAGVPVVHIRNNGGVGDPDEPGVQGWELAFGTRADEPVVDKYEQDAFADTNLADLVPPAATVVIAGMQSEYCIRATSLAALHRGHPVTLVRGAHTTYDGETSAQQVAEHVEAELAATGVKIVAPDHLPF